ncbi:MAG TPA: glycosyltransferase [Solirubrobacteraceae bacterium]|nr:glycosyltransferase [Solirubrobacteraceae bacterium]
MDSRNGSLILCFTTGGHDHVTDQRIRLLLEPLQPEVFAFDHARKLRSAIGLLRTVVARRPRLIVMEGTGIAGGLAVMLIDAVLGIPFVVSSGDAVGPYLRLRSRLLGLPGGLYERLLCRRCAGFVGWTPYLVGRAITFGAPRGMTAPGWTRSRASANGRQDVRRRLGIAPDTLVVGLTGALNLAEHVGYVYGAELVQAVRRLERRDVVTCIVGDGPGLERLREMAGEDLGTRVLLPGRVSPEEVPDYLAAFDMASLSQSVDRVGAFRYTTKLSEYLAAELPIISGESPLAYDLDSGYFWRLPGPAPWSPVYIDALVNLLEAVTPEQVAQRREAVRSRLADPFDKVTQQRRMSEFIEDLLVSRSREHSH